MLALSTRAARHTTRGTGERLWPFSAYAADDQWGGRAAIAPTRLEMSGDHFVDSERELTLDEDNRVVRETLVAPDHLIRRSFTYPEDAGD